MNREASYLAAVCLLGMLGNPAAAVAETAADQLPPALLACAEEVDVMRRLSCYDREMATLQATPKADVPAAPEAPVAPVSPVAAEPPPAPAASAPAAVAATPQASEVPTDTATAATRAVAPQDEFGLDREPSEITANVVDIRKRPYGELVILLDNGQTWEQKHVDRRFKLEIGDEVTIKKGAVSGYRLSGRSNNSIQVQRRE